MSRRNGFSLVELSIVLVILGLLTGGILTGQNLIRAAELRSILTEFRNYQTAIQTFRSQYFALPGDMINAENFWGTNPNGCPDVSKDQTSRKETCNGNGNGIVSMHGVVGTANGTSAENYVEQYTFWQHLANAGLIEGSYTGNFQSVSTDTRLKGQAAGLNTPASRVGGTGWALYTVYFTSHGNYAYGTSASFQGLSWGSSPSAPPANWNYADRDALTPEEAWGIDKKTDDGMPGTGKVTVSQYADCTLNTSSATDYTGTYALTSASKDCGLIFVSPF
jgi:prepilin-type N-terminal cleavage/methylation domain-containing protein